MLTAPTSLRDKAAQVVFARIGSNLPPPVTVEEDVSRVEGLLERCPLGGLVLFNGDRDVTPKTLARLQAQSPYPLLVTADMERGAGQALRGATVFPHAMAYSALGEQAEALAEASAQASAREALAGGIHVTFSPVADVNTNARNPIIATRAFGSRPEEVARLARAYLRGCQKEGLLTAAKHFPGHGSTEEDSHAELPVVGRTRSELEAIDLVPFRAAIEADVDLVMTAHVAFPMLDERGLPATLSRPILHDLLREELGFRGPVITDSLLMGAVREAYPSMGEQAVALLQAGVDILLDVPEPESAVEGLVAAVEAGTLSEARLGEACRRAWALKRRLAARFGPDVFTGGPRPALAQTDETAHRRLAAEVAYRAITSLAPLSPDVLPLNRADVSESGLLVLLVKPNRSRLDPPEEPLAADVRAMFSKARYEEVGPEAGEPVFERLLAQASQVRHVVVALVVKPAAWHAFGLRPAQQRFLEALTQQQPVILVALGSPHGLDRFEQAAARLYTYSDVPASQRALVSYLVGERPL